MNVKKTVKKAVCIFVTAVISLYVCPTALGAESGSQSYTENTEAVKASFDVYMSSFKDTATVKDTVSALPSQNAVSGGDSEAVLIEQGKSADYSVSVSESGMYRIKLVYRFHNAGNGISGQLRLALDGSVACQEMNNIVLRRIWMDESTPKLNAAGDELQPDIIENNDWQTQLLHDNDGMTDMDLMLYLEKGVHGITLTSLREDIEIKEIILGGENIIPDYKTVSEEYKNKGYKHISCKPIQIRAEYPLYKSEQNLIMSVDYSSASTVPSDPVHTVLNTIGGESWRYPGQWITWEFEVPESGLYNLTFKYRQDYQSSMNVYRSVAIDGEIPFSQMSAVEFKPANKWKNQTLSDGEGTPYDFYLEKGKHTVTMDVAYSPLAESLNLLQKTVEEMNTVYRKVFTVTGSSIDTFRDYEIEKEIPDLMDSFKALKTNLEACRDSLLKANGIKSPEISLLDVAIEQIAKFIKKPKKITNGLESFKNNIASLADALLTIKQQPLLLDEIYVTSSDSELPEANLGVLASVTFNIKSFLASFTDKYVGNSDVESGKVLEVWISTGKDQMVTLDQIIQNSFVPENNINVKLSLINSADTLTKAIMGNSGPDCALMLARGMPINYSMRNALVDLSKFEGFDEIAEWFQPTAMTPYTYKDGIYALPETQVYQMMFYRVDIFNELDISPPDTWEDLYKIITRIQRSNMQVGIPPESHQIFQTLLLQAGGTYFEEDLSKTAFTTDAAISAITQWTDFYNKYGLPVKYDAFNRFRTGEVPIVIQGYTFYNQLSIAAPEIRGLWKMVPIPGVAGEDGVIDRSQTSDGTACVIIDDGEENTEEFSFLKWWVGARAQSEYAAKIENRLGESGRYTTANKEAFKAIPWSVEQQEQLLNAWNDVTDLPIVPGNYYVDRSITNAFRAVVYKKLNQRETLLRYNKDMNNEIERKRKEFGF